MTHVSSGYLRLADHALVGRAAYTRQATPVPTAHF